VQTEKEHRKLGREKLQRIIEMCIAIENHAVDPFALEINDIIKIIQEFFPRWEKPEDFNLDSEVIHHIAKVIKLQSEWLKHRSTSLYLDPFLLEEKIVQFGKEDMIRIFLKSWHPVVELERLSLQSLIEALRYWNALLPLEDRWRELDITQVITGTATRDEMIKQRLLGDKYFTEELETFWQALKDKVKEKGLDGKIPYWDFIGAETYEETVQRAFMASFLITYGYANLEIRPLEEKMFIKPLEKVLATIGNQQLVSIPIAVTYEDWRRWKRGELE